MLGHCDHPLARDAGEDVALTDRCVALVRQGVLATWAEHPDGGPALLDLTGPGHLVAGHGPDLCHIRHHALTDVTLEPMPWEEAITVPTVVDGLREVLRWREAWAAAVAHPRTEDQLLDLLLLLADRFGVVCGRTVRIDVALTHGLLAAATGRTRPTVTRALQRLQRARHVATSGRGPAARYLLPASALESAVRHRP